MSEQMKHTPTPWHVADEHTDVPMIKSASGHLIAIPYDGHNPVTDNENLPVTRANAAFIVRAVNSHDDLVAALEEAQLALFNKYPVTEGLENQISAALLKSRAD